MGREAGPTVSRYEISSFPELVAAFSDYTSLPYSYGFSYDINQLPSSQSVLSNHNITENNITYTVEGENIIKDHYLTVWDTAMNFTSMGPVGYKNHDTYYNCSLTFRLSEIVQEHAQLTHFDPVTGGSSYNSLHYEISNGQGWTGLNEAMWPYADYSKCQCSLYDYPEFNLIPADDYVGADMVQPTPENLNYHFYILPREKAYSNSKAYLFKHTSNSTSTVNVHLVSEHADISLRLIVASHSH